MNITRAYFIIIMWSFQSYPGLGPVFRALHGSRNQCVSRPTLRERHANVTRTSGENALS